MIPFDANHESTEHRPACHFRTSTISSCNGAAQTLVYLYFSASMHIQGDQPGSRSTTPMEVHFDWGQLTILLVDFYFYLLLVRRQL
jgi:hypothetical protein